MRHEVEWVTAPPLWDLAQADAGGRPRFRQPALLRFDSDTFMEELIGLMEKGDAALADRVARPEKWDLPAAGWVPAGDPTLSADLRLFQPAHGRFYVTAASLVCRRVGLPVRKVDAAAGERTSMLMRRLVPRPDRTLDPADPASFTEQAWVGDRKAGTWQTLTGTVLPGEERLPLFPLAAAGEQGRKRQVWAGLLPVASREIYEGARPAAAPPPPPPPPTTTLDPLQDVTEPRRAVFQATVLQGLETLHLSPFPPDPTQAAAVAASMRESLSFVLLDLVDFLAAELPDVWDAIEAHSSAGLSSLDAAVFDHLAASFGGSGSWRDALLAADAHRPVLLGTGSASGPAPVPESFSGPAVQALALGFLSGGTFRAKVFAALNASPSAAAEPPGRAPVLAAQAAETVEVEGALYRLRFIYERPQCAPFHDPIVSEPSRPFRLGPFFDPDAPARPLVIRMPFDTSPQGLRRFPKGVAVLMSAELRRQAERVNNQKLADLDEGKVGNDPGWGLGMICSLSIPIITICAFLVLMIFLQLLNIVFFWMAFFKICLPIPVKK
jgi:hypothetical protein